ncbi:MAG: hypothetical protein ACRDYB_10770, partial [Acidimicrobiales bacterium]
GSHRSFDRGVDTGVDDDAQILLGESDRATMMPEVTHRKPGTTLFLLIMGVIQFALWQHAEHIASAVAQQGVAVGRLQGETAGAGQAEARSVLDQLGSSVLVGSDITVTRSDATTTVTVTGHAESILGIFTLPVKAVAVGPTETYTVAAGQGP